MSQFAGLIKTSGICLMSFLHEQRTEISSENRTEQKTNLCTVN